MTTTRRKFLKLSVAAGGALGLGSLPRMYSALAETAAAAGQAPGKPLNILILGGTGFTGPHQVRYALSRGHKVTVFNRGKTHPGELPAGVEQLIGDRNGQLDALKGRKWDVVIDNPTTLPVWVRDAAEVLKGNVDNYVFISTISVYADNSKPNMDETAPVAKYTGPDAMKETMAAVRASNFELYGPLKALSEQEAEKWFPGKTLVIRPGLIVGPGDETDRFSYWPVRIDRGGEVLAPGDPKDPVQIIDARDLAEWTIRMVEQRATGIYNATGPSPAMTHGRHAGRHQGRRKLQGPADLGGHRFPRRAKSRAVVGHAGVGAAARRHAWLQQHQHQEGARSRTDLPNAPSHHARHAGLVQGAARRAAGEIARRHHARARSGSPGGVEGAREEMIFERVR